MVPENWMKINVAPFLEKGKQKKLRNYSPVNLTSVLWRKKFWKSFPNI